MLGGRHPTTDNQPVMGNPSNPIVHFQKLFGGRETAMELHRRLAWNGKPCTGCGSKETAIQIEILVRLSDMEVNLREAVEIEIAMGRITEVPVHGGPAIRTSHVLACKSCQGTAERAAARGAKSFTLVWIDRGPGEDKPMVSVIA